MEEHRANPQCVSCHRVIDPLGLALENFDVVGMWRIRDGGTPIDATGDALRRHAARRARRAARGAAASTRKTVLRTFTENLMAYALGRRVEALRHAGRPPRSSATPARTRIISRRSSSAS